MHHTLLILTVRCNHSRSNKPDTGSDIGRHPGGIAFTTTAAGSSSKPVRTANSPESGTQGD